MSTKFGPTLVKLSFGSVAFGPARSTNTSNMFRGVCVVLLWFHCERLARGPHGPAHSLNVQFEFRAICAAAPGNMFV